MPAPTGGAALLEHQACDIQVRLGSEAFIYARADSCQDTVTEWHIAHRRVSPQEHLLPSHHHMHSSVTPASCEVHGLLKRCQVCRWA